MKNKIFLAVLAVFVGWLGTSCSNNETTSRLIITLTDSPGDYDEVNVDVQGVEVHSSTDDDESGWMTLDNPNTGVVNLLDLTDGVSVVISDSEVPAGKISKIRLMLGPNNTLVIGEDEMDLDVPSGEQSGLKLQVHETLEAGITYTMKLDFDAAKSVVKNGNSGKYSLKPVIRVITEATSGAIKGEVFPAEENVAVYGIVGEDTVVTSYAIADQSGYFLEGVPEGTYKIGYDPGDDSLYAKQTVDGVEVKIGNITQMDPVTLELK